MELAVLVEKNFTNCPIVNTPKSVFVATGSKDNRPAGLGIVMKYCILSTSPDAIGYNNSDYYGR